MGHNKKKSISFNASVAHLKIRRRLKNASPEAYRSSYIRIFSDFV